MYQKGKHAEALHIARNMQAKGFDLAVIKEVTGLADQDITELAELSE